MARLSKQRHNRLHVGTQFDYSPRKNLPTMPVIRVVGCPDCGAVLGAKCVNAAGVPTANHASRKRMAARAIMAQRSDFGTTA